MRSVVRQGRASVERRRTCGSVGSGVQGIWPSLSRMSSAAFRGASRLDAGRSGSWEVLFMALGGGAASGAMSPLASRGGTQAHPDRVGERASPARVRSCTTRRRIRRRDAVMVAFSLRAMRRRMARAERGRVRARGGARHRGHAMRSDRPSGDMTNVTRDRCGLSSRRACKGEGNWLIGKERATRAGRARFAGSRASGFAGKCSVAQAWARVPEHPSQGHGQPKCHGTSRDRPPAFATAGGPWDGRDPGFRQVRAAFGNGKGPVPDTARAINEAIAPSTQAIEGLALTCFGITEGRGGLPDTAQAINESRSLPFVEPDRLGRKLESLEVEVLEPFLRAEKSHPSGRKSFPITRATPPDRAFNLNARAFFPDGKPELPFVQGSKCHRPNV